MVNQYLNDPELLICHLAELGVEVIEPDFSEFKLDAYDERLDAAMQMIQVRSMLCTMIQGNLFQKDEKIEYISLVQGEQPFEIRTSKKVIKINADLNSSRIEILRRQVFQNLVLLTQFDTNLKKYFVSFEMKNLEDYLPTEFPGFLFSKVEMHHRYKREVIEKFKSPLEYLAYFKEQIVFRNVSMLGIGEA